MEQNYAYLLFVAFFKYIVSFLLPCGKRQHLSARKYNVDIG